MQTVSDLKSKLEDIQNETKHFSQEAAGRAFELLKDLPEANRPLEDLENFKGGEYSFDDFGELIYSVEVPSDVADLPFINDYLTRDFGFLTGKRHNDLRLAQRCGPCITVSWG